MKTAVCLALFYWLTGQPAHAIEDQCYRPTMPTMCIMQDDQNISEHIRCTIVNNIKLHDYIRGLTLYQECREAVCKGEKPKQWWK